MRVDSEEVLVVGTGPSGISAIEGLIKKGIRVTIIDGFNYTPEPNNFGNDEHYRFACVEKTLSQKLYKFNKLNYGSNFFSQSFNKHRKIYSNGVGGIAGSLVSGGLGNVWGGAVLPYDEFDLKGWPFSSEQLKKYYDQVSASLDISSPFENDLLFQLGKSEFLENLKLSNLKISSSCIAFNLGDERNCINCGNCIYGCPKGLLYNPKKRLEYLKRLYGNLITHIEDSIVEEFIELHSSVRVKIQNLKNNKIIFCEGSRLFIGAGSISSTYLTLKSLGLFEKTINFLNSQYFFSPLINISSNRYLGRTTAHYFVESSELQNKSHLQLYLHPNVLSDALNFKLFGRYFNTPLNRIGIMQGYLHSSDSSTFNMEIDSSGKILLNSIIHPPAKLNAQKVVRHSLKFLRGMGILTHNLFTKIGKPGEGNHFGGSFPMSYKSQSAFESDLLGRPNGLQRIHLIDSSIFPTIPSKTITLTVMANALRIVDWVYK